MTTFKIMRLSFLILVITLIRVISTDDVGVLSQRHMDWILSHGGTLDGVDIITHNRDYRQLVTKRAVKRGEVLASISPSTILTPYSIKEDPIMKKIVAGSTFTWETHTELLLGLYLLTSAKEDPVWKHYIEFLPVQMSTPHFFNSEELSLLKGTLCALNAKEIMAYYVWVHEHLVTTLPAIFGSLTLKDVLWAIVAIHSRDFTIQPPGSTVNTSGILPILDIADHHRKAECNCVSGYSSETGIATLTALRDLPAGANLLNSYGEKADGDLLNTYGFTLGYSANGDLSKTHLEFPFMRCIILADVRGSAANTCLSGLRAYVSSSTEDCPSPRSRHEELLVFQAIIEETTRRIEEIGSTSAHQQTLLEQMDELAANASAVGDENMVSLFNQRNCLVVVFGELKVLEAWQLWALEMSSVLRNAQDVQSLSAFHMLRQLAPISGLESYLKLLEKASLGWWISTSQAEITVPELDVSVEGDVSNEEL